MYINLSLTVIGQNHCSGQAAVAWHVDVRRGSKLQPEPSTTAQRPACIPVRAEHNSQ